MKRTVSLLLAFLWLLTACRPVEAETPSPASETLRAPATASLSERGPFPIASPTPRLFDSPSLNDCPLFPADNFWNVPIASLPVHPQSQAWVQSIGAQESFHMDFGSGTWDGGPIGIPYTLAPAKTRLQPLLFDEYGEESDPGPYPIPAETFLEWGSDQHLLIVHAGECKLYELYHAHQENGQWYAGSGAVWDLNSNALRPLGWTSADAAGLPLLPGLARYDEAAAGEMRHALRFTAAQTAGFVWPARHQTADSQPGLPPLGARFRLKAGFDLSPYPPILQALLRAMQTYGIVLADNGANWYISGAPDPRWDNDMLHLLDALHGSDFEAVDTSLLMQDPDSAAAK